MHNWVRYENPDHPDLPAWRCTKCDNKPSPLIWKDTVPPTHLKFTIKPNGKIVCCDEWIVNHVMIQ